MTSLPRFLGRCAGYAKLWLHWIAEPKAGWITSAGIVIALAIPACVASRDDHLRYSGLMLQLLGIGTVAMGVRDKGRIFGKITMWQWAHSWFRRVPKWHRKSVTLEVDSVSHAHMASSASVWQWRNIPDSLPLEDKLKLVNENLETLKTQWQASEKRQGEVIRTLQTAVDTERTTRETALTQVTTRLNELGSGGLRMEAMGLAWLITGVVFATIPQELAKLF
jgi:hypothetical protein